MSEYTELDCAMVTIREQDTDLKAYRAEIERLKEDNAKLLNTRNVRAAAYQLLQSSTDDAYATLLKESARLDWLASGGRCGSINGQWYTFLYGTRLFDTLREAIDYVLENPK